MVQRFGSREICDVTFKALTNNQKVGNKEFKAGQPVFVIDTATASNMEQASTTVYAQGGRGYNRLIAWEGEKTMTFTVTDALMSPLGLAVLTGAGFADEEAVKHVHVTYDVAIGSDGVGHIKAKDLAGELGLSLKSAIQVCNDTDLVPYATILDGNGAIKGWADSVTFLNEDDTTIEHVIIISDNETLDVKVVGAENNTAKLDFYVRMTTGATEITIQPDDFGGFFYVEADTLYRNQDGKDMAATLTFPKVKIQSAFTLAMAPTGDPSTFDFVMDAMPAYTYFDHTKKVVCDMVIVSGAGDEDTGVKHSDPVAHNESTNPRFNVGGTKIVKVADDVNKEKSQANQDAITVEEKNNIITVTADVDSLNEYASTNPSQGSGKWVGLAIDTGEEGIIGVNYNGYALTQDDVDEAASVGVGAGKFVLWLKAEAGNKTFTLAKEGKADTTVAVKIVDTGANA